MRIAVVLALLLCASRPGAADVYVYVDKGGTKHFTNVEPPKSRRGQYRVLFPTGPGKAGTVSGTYSSHEGCKKSRADVVPAQDKSPERLVRYNGFIAEAARLYAIPEALIRAVIKIESDFDPRVVSCAGAKGLMQVMPDEEVSERIEHVFDPRENILAGARMLRTKANHWRGDMQLTLASYHAGVGAVTKYHGIPPYATTQKYVQLVLKAYDRYRMQEMAQAGKGSSG